MTKITLDIDQIKQGLQFGVKQLITNKKLYFHSLDLRMPASSNLYTNESAVIELRSILHTKRGFIVKLSSKFIWPEILDNTTYFEEGAFDRKTASKLNIEQLLVLKILYNLYKVGTTYADKALNEILGSIWYVSSNGIGWIVMNDLLEDPKSLRP